MADKQEFLTCKRCKNPQQFTSREEYSTHLRVAHGIEGQKEQIASIKVELEKLSQREQDIKLAEADVKEKAAALAKREKELDKREAAIKAREEEIAKTIEGNTQK